MQLSDLLLLLCTHFTKFYSSPVRHKVDLSSSGGGQGREEGESALQGEGEAGNRVENAHLLRGTGPPTSPQASLFGELSTHQDARGESHRGFHLHAGSHHGGEAAIPSDATVELQSTDGTGDGGTPERQALGYQASRNKGLCWPWGPTEERSLIFSQGGDMGSP